MIGNDCEFSIWAGSDKEAPEHLVPVSPPKRLEVNGAPVVEQSHEFVMAPKPDDLRGINAKGRGR